jgi:HEAT repeat protein
MPNRPLLPLASLVLGLLAACSSSPSEPEAFKGPEQFVPPPDPDDAPMGKLLADFDNMMRFWTNLMLNARSEEERRQAREMEALMGVQSVRRFDELVAELQSGPARNRQRAAAALGFSRDRAALPHLVAALGDPEPDVVHNALLGLTLLGFRETPSEAVVVLLRESGDPDTRSNAASALRTFVEAGQDPAPYLTDVRAALHDESGGVRVQCALLVGLAADSASIERLSDMTHQPEPLVANAAVEALLMIGKADDHSKGKVARTLVERWRGADEQLEQRLRIAMVMLAGIDYGEDEQLWIEWAQRLP